MNLNKLPLSLRKEFRSLPAPENFDALAGAHRGVYVGPAPLRMSAPFFMGALRFGHWYGKRFQEAAPGADVLEGANRFADGEPQQDRYAMIASIGPLLVDGRPAYVIEYPPDTPRPWNSARDELRVIDDGRMLGVSVFQHPVVRMLPLVFVLERDPSSPAAEAKAERSAAGQTAS